MAEATARFASRCAMQVVVFVKPVTTSTSLPTSARTPEELTYPTMPLQFAVLRRPLVLTVP